MSTNPVANGPTDGAARSAASRHEFLLLFALAVLVAAPLLEVHGDRVALVGLSDYPLPHLCMSRSLFGISCPGCGLTRSFIYLAHGDWQSAWTAHRLGWLLAAIVLFQVPYRAWMLAGRGRGLPTGFVQAYAAVVVGLLLLNWASGLVERNSFRLSNAGEVDSAINQSQDRSMDPFYEQP